jgi:hypothetical protein
MTPEANVARPQVAPLQRARRDPFLPVDQWLLKFAEDILAGSEPGPSATTPKTRLTQMAVTMTKRYRATSVADMVGIFSPNGTNEWLDVPIANFHVLPIVNPQVRANMSCSVQAKVQLLIESTTSDPRLKGSKSVAESISRYVDDLLWTNQVAALNSERCQLAGGSILRSFHNEDKESENLTTPEWGEEALTQPGEYACRNCNTSGPYKGGIEEDEDAWMTGECPACRQTCDVLKAPEQVTLPAPTGFRQFNAGDNDLELISTFQIRVDERNTKGGDLERAEWFEWHRLRPDYEMAEENPQFEWNAPKEWSYSLKWERALETCTNASTKWWNDSQGGNLHEERIIFLRPKRYKHYIAPYRYEFSNPQGEPVVIEQGDKLIDHYPDGLCFKVSNDKFLAINPKDMPVDFRHQFTFVQWLPDPFSFWPLPNIVLLPLQDNGNTQFTLWMQHLERNSLVSLAYNSKAFESEDFETDLIPTRNNFSLENSDDIRNHITEVKMPELREPMVGLQFILSIIGIVGGMQPAAVGAPSPGEPYAAQRLQKESSLGLLTPYLESIAQGKVSFMKNQLRIAKENWTPERFEHIRTRYNEEWKDEDVRAFLECNLDRDIRITYIEGTEIPTSLIERQMKLENFLAKIAEIAQLAPQLITPAFVKDVVAKLAEMSDIDLDIENVEADRMLAAARYEKIKKYCAAGLPPEEMFAEPGMTVMSNVEDHQTHMEFYSDHLRALMAADLPDVRLIGCPGCDDDAARRRGAARSAEGCGKAGGSHSAAQSRRAGQRQ